MVKNEIIKRLNNFLIKDTFLISFEKNLITLKFKNYNYSIKILSVKSESKSHIKSIDSIIFFDKSFKSLKKIINNDPLDYLDMGKFYSLKKTIESFSEENKDFYKSYRDLSFYRLKVIFADIFKINEDPGNEFFIFGSDDIRSRFKNSPLDFLYNDNISKEGILARVIDESVYYFEDSNCLDLVYGDFLLKGDTMYLSNKLYIREKISEKKVNELYAKNGFEDSDVEVHIGHLVTGAKVKSYYIKKLNTKIDIDNNPLVKKLKVKKMNNEIISIKQSDNGFLFFYNDKEVRIDHPDMLIYIMSGLVLNPE